MKSELRSLNTQPIRVEGNTLYGTAIPYNSLSHDLGGFQERFLPGSVSDSVKAGLIEAWLYHDSSMPLASLKSGTLRLNDDERGLHYEIDLPDTSYVADFRKLLNTERKDVGGSSFGFYPNDKGDSWTRQDGKVIRTISSAVLQHISPVITPAYPTTTAAIRSLAGGEADPDALYGIDVERLAQVFVAIKRGLPLNETETQIAELAMGHLRSAIPRTRLKAAERMAQSLLL